MNYCHYQWSNAKSFNMSMAILILKEESRIDQCSHFTDREAQRSLTMAHNRQHWDSSPHLPPAAQAPWWDQAELCRAAQKEYLTLSGQWVTSDSFKPHAPHTAPRPVRSRVRLQFTIPCTCCSLWLERSSQTPPSWDSPVCTESPSHRDLPWCCQWPPLSPLHTTSMLC